MFLECTCAVRDFMKVIEKRKDTIVISIDKIKQKMIFIDVGEYYVCALPNTIEMQSS